VFCFGDIRKLPELLGSPLVFVAQSGGQHLRIGWRVGSGVLFLFFR